MREATKNALVMYNIHLLNENDFQVSKHLQLTFIYLYWRHLANEFFIWEVYVKF